MTPRELAIIQAMLHAYKSADRDHKRIVSEGKPSAACRSAREDVEAGLKTVFAGRTGAAEREAHLAELLTTKPSKRWGVQKS